MNDIYSAYTDGSFDAPTGVYGSSFIIFKGKRILHESNFANVHPIYSNSWNIAGETFAVLRCLEWCVENKINSITIYHDLQMLSFEFRKTKSELSRFYRDSRNEFMKKISVKFVWVKGHQGNRGNEIADYLAGKAVDDYIAKNNPMPFPYRKKYNCDALLKYTSLYKHKNH